MQRLLRNKLETLEMPLVEPYILGVSKPQIYGNLEEVVSAVSIRISHLRWVCSYSSARFVQAGVRGNELYATIRNTCGVGTIPPLHRPGTVLYKPPAGYVSIGVLGLGKGEDSLLLKTWGVILLATAIYLLPPQHLCHLLCTHSSLLRTLHTTSLASWDYMYNRTALREIERKEDQNTLTPTLTNQRSARGVS